MPKKGEAKGLLNFDSLFPHRHPLLDVLREIRDAILLLSHPSAPASLGLAVTSVKGRPPMAIKPVPPLTMTDVQHVQLSLSPKLPNGNDDPGPFTWVSSDAANFPIVGDTVDADGNHIPDPTNTAPNGTVAWVVTPTDVPGTTTVTVTSASANVNGNSIDITVLEGKEGDVNLSAGVPVAD